MTHDEDSQYRQLKALNDLLRDHSTAQLEVIRHLKLTIVIISICFTLIICCMTGGFFYYESQYETTDAVTSTETTTTELKTEGENASINSVTNGNMYNDNAVHND